MQLRDNFKLQNVGLSFVYFLLKPGFAQGFLVNSPSLIKLLFK